MSWLTLTSAETRKGVAAGLMTLARLLDNPLALLSGQRRSG